MVELEISNQHDRAKTRRKTKRKKTKRKKTTECVERHAVRASFFFVREVCGVCRSCGSCQEQTKNRSCYHKKGCWTNPATILRPRSKFTKKRDTLTLKEWSRIRLQLWETACLCMSTVLSVLHVLETPRQHLKFEWFLWRSSNDWMKILLQKKKKAEELEFETWPNLGSLRIWRMNFRSVVSTGASREVYCRAEA